MRSIYDIPYNITMKLDITAEILYSEIYIYDIPYNIITLNYYK